MTATSLSARLADNLAGHDDPRTRIAAQILHVVVDFAYDGEVYDQLETGELDLHAEESEALAAERHIRALAKEAEGNTNRYGQVITAVLADRYLLDDYLRIKAVEQHYAFDDDITPIEEEAEHQRLVDRAVEARERAEWWVEHNMRQAAVCRCGATQGRHDAQTRDRLPGLGMGVGRRNGDPCGRFTAIEETTTFAVSEDALIAGWTHWLSAHGHAENPTAVEEGTRVLLMLKRTGRHTVGDAYTAAAASIALT